VPLDLGPLREIPVHRTLTQLYYRTVYLPSAGAPDPLFTHPQTGRWPTEYTLYTSGSEVVVWAEYCRNHPEDIDAADLTGGVGIDAASLRALGHLEVAEPLARRALFQLTFSFERLADLTSEWAHICLERAGFSLDSFYADEAAGYGDCPQLSALQEALGWEAMRVPSAAWRSGGGSSTPVFRLGMDRLGEMAEVVPAARPTVAVAFATTYPIGRRPRWLAVP
jgi:hypothetical protein